MRHSPISTGTAIFTAPGGPLHVDLTRHVHTLVWHTLATPEGREVTAETVDRWHKDRGWTGIGYHLLVHLDGSVSAGRNFNKIGAHVKGYNRPTLGYCYVGGVDREGKPKDTRTAAQKATMLCLTQEAIEHYGVTAVKGHRDYSPDLDGDGVIEPFEFIKACPCFDAIPEYSHLLSGRPAGPAAPTGAEVPTDMGLRTGAVGEDVIRLQELLGLEPTGEFDATTARAVIAAKRQIGLYPSEIVLPYVFATLQTAKADGSLRI